MYSLTFTFSAPVSFTESVLLFGHADLNGTMMVIFFMAEDFCLYLTTSVDFPVQVFSFQYYQQHPQRASQVPLSMLVIFKRMYSQEMVVAGQS